MSLIKKPFELEVSPTIKVLIYGQPGIGKSSLSLSAPAPLFFDFDGGVNRVNPKHLKETVQVKEWKDIVEVLKEDLTPYKTFVIDTAGKMIDFMTKECIKNNPKYAQADGTFSLKGYGARKAMFQSFLGQVSLMGKHLVFTAHEKEEKDGDNRFIRPEIGGSSGGDLIKEIDLVGYMEAIGKKRTISFDPCEKFYGKNTCNLPSRMDLPDIMTQPNTLLSEIFATYAKNLEERKVIAGDYNSLLEVIANGIDEATTCEELNEKVTWALGLNHIWDSKLVASYQIKTKAASMECIIDKVTKKYAPTPITAP